MQAERPPHPGGLTGAITSRCNSLTGKSNTKAMLKANKAAAVPAQREGYHATKTFMVLMKIIRAGQRLSLRGMSDLKSS
jgi:hypothetical protein